MNLMTLLPLDVARCGGELCPDRNSCLRYAASVEATKRIAAGGSQSAPCHKPVPYITSQYDHATQSCKMLIKIDAKTYY